MLKIKKIRNQKKWQIFDTETKKIIETFDSLEKAKEYIKKKKLITKQTEQRIKQNVKAQRVPRGRGGGGGRGGGIRYQQIDEALLQRKLMELQQRQQAITQKELDNSRKEIMKERFGYTEAQANEVLKRGQDAYDRTQGSQTDKAKAREQAEHRVQIDILADEYQAQLANEVPKEILTNALSEAKIRANLTTDSVVANNAFIQKLSNEIRRGLGYQPVNLPPLNERTLPIYYLDKSVFGGKLFDMKKYITPDAENFTQRFSRGKAEDALTRRDQLPRTPLESMNLQLSSIKGLKDKTVEEINRMFEDINKRQQVPQIEDIPMIDPDVQIESGTNVQDPRNKNDAGNNTVNDQPTQLRKRGKGADNLFNRLEKSFEQYEVDPIERQGALNLANQEFELRGVAGLTDHVSKAIRKFRLDREEAVKELESSVPEIPVEQVSGEKRKAQEPVVQESENVDRQQTQNDMSYLEPQQFSAQEPPAFLNDAFEQPFQQFSFQGAQALGPISETPYLRPKQPGRKKKKKATLEQPVQPVVDQSVQEFLSNQAMASEEQRQRQQQQLNQLLENPNVMDLPRSFGEFGPYKTRRLEEPAPDYLPQSNLDYAQEQRKVSKKLRRKLPLQDALSSDLSVTNVQQEVLPIESQGFGEALGESRTSFE